MRKITRLAAEAFKNGRKFQRDNTAVVVDDNSQRIIVKMYLHANLIAQYTYCTLDGVKRLEMTLAGWPTPTTRERLNGLLNVLGVCGGFRQSDFIQFYGSASTPSQAIDSNQWITEVLS